MSRDAWRFKEALFATVRQQMGVELNGTDVGFVAIELAGFAGELMGFTFAERGDGDFADMIRLLNDRMWDGIREGQRNRAKPAPRRRRQRSMGTT